MDKEAIRQTKQQLRRVRKRRRLQQRVLDGKELNPHHDLLVVPPAKVIKDDELFRVPVVKVAGVVNQGESDSDDAAKGTYVDSPELLDSYDYAQRRTLSIAKPQAWGNPDQFAIPRGPAFGTLPVKREPAATASAACYLIDAQNLTFRNAWTAEEWTGISVGDHGELPVPSATDDRGFEVLLAGPRGKVFHLKVDIADKPWVMDQAIPITIKDGKEDIELGQICCIDLRYEVEIWNQLRNGLVAGRVCRRGDAQDSRPTPIVNITTLVPEDANDKKGA